MPRDTIYYTEFTENSIGYRWELIPADRTVLPETPDEIDMGDIILSTSASTASFRDNYPLGFVQAIKHTLKLDADAIEDTGLLDYIISPDIPDAFAVTFTRDGSDVISQLYPSGETYNENRASSNLWTLLTDDGDGLDTWRVVFQGVQQRADSVKFIGGEIEIELQDIGYTILDSIQTAHLGYYIRADERNIYGTDGDGIATGTALHTETGEALSFIDSCFFNMLYVGDDDNAVMGHIDIINQKELGIAYPDGSSGKTFNFRHFHTWYSFTEVYYAVSKLIRMACFCYMRRTPTVLTTASPTVALTFYKQGYTQDGARGAALTNNDLHFMGFARGYGSNPPTHHYGYFHRDDANGIVRRYRTLYDWLNDHVESLGAYAKIGSTTRTELMLTYSQIIPSYAIETIDINDFVGDIDEQPVEVEAWRLRGCTVQVPGLDGNSVRDIEYMKPRSRSEADYNIEFPAHATPTSLNGSDTAQKSDGGDGSGYTHDLLSDMGAHVLVIYKEQAFFSDKIGYLDTAPFMTTQRMFLPHRCIDWTNGSATFDGTEGAPTYTFPALPSGSSNDQWKNFRDDYAWTQLQAITIDIQRNCNPSLTIAKGITNTFDVEMQVLYEATMRAYDDNHTPLFPLFGLGGLYPFNADVIRAHYDNLPNQLLLVEVTPDYENEEVGVKLLGII